jgi:hypothetical protein
VRHVDRNPLLAFGSQAVGEQGGIEIASGGTVQFGVALYGRQLILVDHLGVVQEPSDERALPVIDAPARDESQQLLVLVLPKIRLDVGGDQIRLM